MAIHSLLADLRGKESIILIPLSENGVNSILVISKVSTTFYEPVHISYGQTCVSALGGVFPSQAGMNRFNRDLILVKFLFNPGLILV